MGSKWRKAKIALGLNLCYYVPKPVEDDDSSPSGERLSDAALLSRPATTGSWSSLRFSRSSSRRSSNEKTCSICLASMNPGEGHAIFTAECGHSFHFQCITSNVKHGNQICPVCRATWKEIPLQSSSLDPGPGGRPRITPPGWPAQNNAVMTVLRRLPPSPRNSSRHTMPLFQGTEPAVFDDDESLGQNEAAQKPETSDSDSNTAATSAVIDVKTYPEVSSVPQTKSCTEFTVLVHLKAAISSSMQTRTGPHGEGTDISRTPRTPVDLVTVLDISGSMAGTKLALLKRAMGFVIQNLSSRDRLSVIAFSSTARRLFPLRRMSEAGRQQALLAVNSLVANGGTNIAEGLRKGAKVMEERRERNAVASIILLSDGQDTYTVSPTGTGASGAQTEPNYQLLLPLSIQGGERPGFRIPVHAFGFGADHDASSMHSISEISGGTFSFIETEAAIQDAFAQCIGGLLSVVVQDLTVEVECMHPSLGLKSVKAGSYPNRINNGRSGVIDVGHLYADEERDFLLVVNVPEEPYADQTPLLKVKCSFKDPFTKETMSIQAQDVKVRRPANPDPQELVGSIEVDRQRNRLRAAEAMSQARSSAERGDLSDAITILEDCRKVLTTSISGQAQDRLCIALDAELKEMQERMASRHVYEASGRAYILSGLSSHSWQRATARGDSTESSSLIQAYQTPSMVEMLTRSQATLVSSPTARRPARPVWPLASPKPR